MIVTVTPSPSLDLTHRLDGALRPGALHRATETTLEPGGKGVNVSRWLGVRGRRTVAVLPAGGEPGRLLLRALDEQGIPHRAVAQAAATRVNTTVVGAGHCTKVNAPGRLAPEEASALITAIDEVLRADPGRREPVWLVVCGSLPHGAGPELVTALLAVARAATARCAVDTEGPALRRAIEAGADLASPNLAELAAAFPGQVPPDPDGVGSPAVAAAVSALAARHGCALLVSDGARGALWSDGREAVRAAAPRAVPVNPVGAGDALLAAWLAAGEEVPVADRLARAVRAGTAACAVLTTAAPVPDRSPRRADRAAD